MRQQVFAVLIIIILLFGGCTNKKDELSPQAFDELEIIEETKEELIKEMETKAENQDIEGSLSKLSFEYVSGQYTRKVIQDETEYIETIAIDKNSFLRIAKNDMEQEVFAYNYKSDDFTYLYYFDSELLSKTKFNVETGAIIEDEEGYAGLLDIDAQELKIYFDELINQANIDKKQLIK